MMSGSVSNDSKQAITRASGPIQNETLRCAYSQLAKINGEINKMDEWRLDKKLKKYNLDLTGDELIKKKRLKEFYKKVKLASIDLFISNNLLPYYVVLDFEATCEEVNPPGYKHEIIEFPAVLVNSSTLAVEDTFRMICKPSVKPKLSDFCKDLTGITQEEIDSAHPFPHVMNCFQTWLKDHGLEDCSKFAVVTDGPWDMCRFLFVQCAISNVPYPEWAKTWINIRKLFSSFYRSKRASLANMLDHLKMTFDGRPHSGIDDAKNISRILLRIICDGATIQVNEKLTTDPEKVRTLLDGIHDVEQDLAVQLSALNLEADRVCITTEKLTTFTEVRKKRLKAEIKLAMSLQGEKSTQEDDEEVNESCENVEIVPAFRHKKQNCKKKRKKGKGNFRQ